MDDSLRRDDLRPTIQQTPQPRTRTLWCVMFGDARRRSFRLYTKTKAARIASRFNRLYRTDVAYPDRFGRVCA